MPDKSLATLAGEVAQKIAGVEPTGLCLTFGVNEYGMLQLSLVGTDDLGVDIAILETTDAITADILVEEMENAIHRCQRPPNQKLLAIAAKAINNISQLNAKGL